MICAAMNLTPTETYLAAFHDASPGTDLLTPDGREDLRQRDLLALRPLCGPNGNLLFKERHRQFSARAVR